MLLLAVDTSGSTGSLALAKIADGRVSSLQETSWIKKAMHSEIATVQLQSLLAQGGVTLAQLTHFAVNVGPGSFTGLRVGISLIKTLAFSLGHPVSAVNSLELLAHDKGLIGEKIFVATKAVQNFFYCASFEKKSGALTPILAPRSAADSELAQLSAGCSRVLIEGQTPGFSPETSAKVLVDFLTSLTPPRHFLSWNQIEPLYIRGSEAEEKLKRGLLKPLN